MHDQQRKILILGGNIAQVPLIKASKIEGYHVVLVDYTTTNPGIALADTHYQVNFMDREAVLEIGRQEQVQGVISNSEAAMPIVAYVSEQLGLVGNSLDSVLKISSKIDFRVLQKKIGVYAPEHIVTGSFEEAQRQIGKLTFPIVMKPSKSSGSRGTTKVTDRGSFQNYQEEWNACSRFSMDGQVVLEEFVEPMTPDSVIEGDVFICNGRILWDGLFTNKRSLKAPMVPMMDVFPALLNEGQLCQVKKNIEQLLCGAGIVFGEYNIEMYYTPQNELFCIEINARQGGNGIPDIVQQHCGIDMYKLLVTTTVGDHSYFEEICNQNRCYKYIVRQLVFSREDGAFLELFIAPELQPYVTDIQLFRQPGEAIQTCVTAADIVGWVDLEFESRQQQVSFLKQIEEEIYPIVKTV